MNVIQTRQRRCSSRLNNMAYNNNSTPTHASNTSNASLAATSNRIDQMCYPGMLPNELSRILPDTPAVKFRSLPFFDVIDELIPPKGLISDGFKDREHESHVEFKLTVDQADMLGLATNTNTKMIILRFCYLDCHNEQDDNFPHDCTVTVNGANIHLPPAISNPNKPNIPPKRPGTHVDITGRCRICPFVQNVIDVKWFADPLELNRSYSLNLLLVEKLSTDVLLGRIKDRGLSDPESTKRLILDSDNEVATTNLQSSLLCPVGKTRMTFPCKASTCQHIPCFDALFYLQMNERKPLWVCPVCDKPAYYRDLMLDGFFMEILENAETMVTEVTLNSDGTWSPVTKQELPTSARNQAQLEIITISDDED